MNRTETTNDRCYRAWQFLHPDLDVVSNQAGLQLAPTGKIALLNSDASIRQSILLLLSTRPGERVMHPDYGCNLHQLVFSPNDDTTAGLAIYYVRQAIERWIPRIQILYLDAGRNPDHPAQLDIVLEFRLWATSRSEMLDVAINLSGE
jgi:uncharacterized protein